MSRTPSMVHSPSPRPSPRPAGPTGSRKSSVANAGVGAGDVKVVARVRPPNAMELEKGEVCVRFPSEETIELEGETKEIYTFTYDRVFTPESSQADVFEYVAKPIVADVMQGYNGTIFAYGQTSSGKTHTMEGPDIHDPGLKGVIPRTVSHIFESVGRADTSLEFSIQVSYIEIYMEQIKDLLDRFKTKTNLAVREDKQRGVYVAGATEEYVTSEEELLEVMANGKANRMVAATGMNQGSSRSHSVFIIRIQQRDMKTSTLKSGTLYLVDLAGSEMVKKTHATGQILEEAKTINKSLSALGQVINALTDQKSQHVPYRDSKLTRVLQNSLGGNAKTCLIVNCSPSSYNATETLSTLRFGNRAKSIQNKAVVNETRSVEELSAELAKAESAITLQADYILVLESKMKALKSGQQSGGQETQSAAEGSTAERPPASGAARADSGMAAVVEQLNGRIQQLITELEEEKAESTRRAQETEKLTEVLAQKELERAQTEALANEAMGQCEVHKQRAEDLGDEKSQLETQRQHLESLLAEERDTLARHKFELDEARLNLDMMAQENASLVKEVKELTGDSVAKSTVSPARSSPARTQAAQPPPPPPPQVIEQKPADSSMGSPSPDLPPRTEDHAPLEDMPELPPAALEYLRVAEQRWEAERAALTERAQDTGREMARVRQEYEERLATNLLHKDRLAQDLHGREVKVQELEAIVEGRVEASLAEKPLRQMKAMQQRLEQLVAVHRQLLRKFAQLELENSDCRKKIHLRDERIRQLELNSRSLATNMRTQAERHVAELSKLREQVTTLHKEQQKQMEARLNPQEPLHHLPHHERRVIRGGGPDHQAHEVKTLRGGGGRVSSNPGDDAQTNGGFLSRLFANRK